MEWLTSPEIWIAFFTLTALEIVLGIDNIIFISILVDKLPKEKREFARRIGLLTDGPTCAHCEKLFSTHGDALCPVLARWQRKQGRGSIPSPGQAADVRKAIADDEAARQRAAAKRAAKNSQGNLF